MFLKKSDDELMARISQGDPAAFRELFDRHAARVLGYCTRFFGSRSKGEDVSQEVWMRVIKSAVAYRAEGKFSGWLSAVMRTACLTEWRKDAQHAQTEYDDALEAESADPDKAELEDKLAKQHDLNELKRQIDGLPQNQRAVLVLWMSEELSYEEIAKQTDLSVSSVKSLLFRARQNLEKGLRS